MRRAAVLLGAALTATAPAQSQSDAQRAMRSGCAPPPPGEKVALVLPGGGSKGMAHIGVIKVLDSLGVVPDLIVATSMGSVVGGVYASGHSGAEIERLTQRYNIGAYIGRYAPRAPRAFAISGVGGASLLGSALPGEPTPLVLLRGGSEGFSFATSFADQGVVNLLLTALLVRGDLMAHGSFDALPIPFRAVATDGRTGARVVLDHGDLAQAVRASVAIPLVFDPVTIEGRLLVDGGLSENIPVRLAQQLGATRIILSRLDATGRRNGAPPPQTDGPIDMMMNRIFVDTHPPLGPRDVEVRTDVSDISNLDFSPSTVRTLIERGSAAARATPVASCLPRRTRVTRPLPPISAALVTPDAPPGAADLLRSAVAPAESRLPGWLKAVVGTSTRAPIGSGHNRADSAAVVLDTIQARLARLGTSGLVRALWLTPQPARADSIAFDPVIQWPERRSIGMGGSFDNDLGGQAWLAVADHKVRPAHWLPELDDGGRLTLGSRRQEGFVSVLRAVTDVRYTITPFALLLASRESAPFFTVGPRGTAVKVDLPIMTEQILQLGLNVPFTSAWAVQTGGLLRRWHGGLGDVDRTPLAIGVALRLDHTVETRVPLGRVDLEWNDHYRRASTRVAWTTTPIAQLSSVVRVGAVTANAPYSARFLLGGTDGFPGLNVGESIGTWTASYMLDAARPLYGVVNAQVTGMTGTVSPSSDRAFGGAWLFGVRLGIGADSPLGPIRLQYGLATTGRRQWFARVGRWI